MNVLLAEDDENIRRLIKKNLETNGFNVFEAENGKSALDIFTATHIDILITDIMMPCMDGNALTLAVREINKDIPVLTLTALGNFYDKEKSFLSGADDYMVKPIDMKEMILRLNALLRRYKINMTNKIELKTFSMTRGTNTVLVNGESIELTKKEYLLLFKLLSSSGKIFTRNQLLDEIWGYDSESDDRTIDTHIKRLRERVRCADFEIVTVRGLGYKAVLK